MSRRSSQRETLPRRSQGRTPRPGGEMETEEAEMLEVVQARAKAARAKAARAKAARAEVVRAKAVRAKAARAEAARVATSTARGHRSNSLQTTCRCHRRSRCRPSFLLRTSRCSSGTARSNSTMVSPNRLSVARSLTHLLDGIWAAISVRGAEVVAEAVKGRRPPAEARTKLDLGG